MKKILLFILAVMLAVPAMASAADQLPKGFIAVSEFEMTWSQAKAWCQQRGGRLPLIGGSGSLSWDSLGWDDDSRQGTPIDGFGTVGDPWPTGLPSVNYWTGTETAGCLW
jgi:hypothetical protein